MDYYKDLAGAEGVAYARKSTVDPKNPGKSIVDQTDVTVVGLTRLGVNVIDCLSDDGIGVSRHSKVKIRQGFEKAMGLIRERPSLRVVGLFALSRATRQLKVFGDFLDVCEKHGVLLYVGGRMYDPSAWQDRMALGIEAVVDEAEASRARENTIRGTTGAAARGLPHGPNLYGYRRVYHETTRALVKVEIVPTQAAILREIAQRVLAGDTHYAIVNDLNGRGQARTRGGVWHTSMLKRTVTNPAYAGRRYRHGEDVAVAVWPRILDEETVMALGAHFEGRPRERRNSNAKYPLTGMVICGRCDVLMYRAPAASGAHYYGCKRCRRGRRAAQLESVVIEAAQAMIQDPAFRVAFETPVGWDRAEELAALEMEEADLDAAIKAGLSASRALAVEQRLAPRLQELRAERSRFAAFTETPLPTVWPEDKDEERELLRRLVRVVCHEAKRGRNFDYGSFEITKAPKE